MTDETTTPEETTTPTPEAAPAPSESSPPDSGDVAAVTTDVPAPVAEIPAQSVLAARAAPSGGKGGGYFWGTGRRKTSVARVRIRPGDGKFLVNKREIPDHFFAIRDQKDVVAPLKATNMQGKYDVFVNVSGGGQTGQAGAVLLGLARALKAANPELEPALRDGNYLTRDARKVERKKPGQPGARKRFQFSKR